MKNYLWLILAAVSLLGMILAPAMAHFSVL